MVQEQLQFERVGLLSAMYQKLVHWLQVSTKTWLMFATLMLAMHIPRILIDYVS